MNEDLLRQELRCNWDKSYVYALYKPCGTIFYVGVGNKYRVFQHGLPSDSTGHNPFRIRTIQKIRKEGGEIGRQVLKYFDTREESLKLEVELIKYFGRRNNNTGILVNLTDGGEGCTGLKFSEETKRKMSAKRKGRRPSVQAREALLKKQSYPVLCLNNMLVFRDKKILLKWLEHIKVNCSSNSISYSDRQCKAVSGMMFSRVIDDTPVDVELSNYTDIPEPCFFTKGLSYKHAKAREQSKP